jgi:hypothetical protein
MRWGIPRGLDGLNESVPSPTGLIPWSAATRESCFGGRPVRKRMKGEPQGSTVEQANLGGRKGQESIGSSGLLTKAKGVRLLGWSKALKSKGPRSLSRALEGPLAEP